VSILRDAVIKVYRDLVLSRRCEQAVKLACLNDAGNKLLQRLLDDDLMAVLRPVCLRVLADYLRGRLDPLAIEGEGPGRKANLHGQDVQKRLDGLDVLIYPDLDAHVLDLLSVGVHEVESLIGFIIRIEIAV